MSSTAWFKRTVQWERGGGHLPRLKGVLAALALGAMPLAAQAMPSFKAISAGDGFSMALAQGGEVWAWGDNDNGELGIDGPSTSSPSQVSGLSGITAIAAGYNHALALAQTGAVWAWGSNGGGALGDGTTDDHESPIKVPGLPGIKAISTSAYDSLALARDGVLWGWGWNEHGALGIGNDEGPHNSPVRVGVPSSN
jgi:alpha-tubulin suppressor-like RCC1 family protein